MADAKWNITSLFLLLRWSESILKIWPQSPPFFWYHASSIWNAVLLEVLPTKSCCQIASFCLIIRDPCGNNRGGIGGGMVMCVYVSVRLDCPRNAFFLVCCLYGASVYSKFTSSYAMRKYRSVKRIEISIVLGATLVVLVKAELQLYKFESV